VIVESQVGGDCHLAINGFIISIMRYNNMNSNLNFKLKQSVKLSDVTVSGQSKMAASKLSNIYLSLFTRYQRNFNGYTYVCEVQLSRKDSGMLHNQTERIRK